MQSNFVVGDHQWRTKSNRKKAKELKEKEREFNAKQQDLIKLNVDDQDSAQLLQNNQVLNCIDSCKKKTQRASDKC